MTEEFKTQIYQDYSSKVKGYILSKINNYSLAEDLCSDVFVKVYEKLDTFDDKKASISTWIYTITRNTLIDYYRKNKETLKLKEEIAVPNNDEDSVCTQENLEILANKLETLDSKEKTIILLHYYKGLTLKEIAEKMSISYAYAKVLHKKALLGLKKAFK